MGEKNVQEGSGQEVTAGSTGVTAPRAVKKEFGVTCKKRRSTGQVTAGSTSVLAPRALDFISR